MEWLYARWNQPLESKTDSVVRLGSWGGVAFRQSVSCLWRPSTFAEVAELLRSLVSNDEYNVIWICDHMRRSLNVWIAAEMAVGGSSVEVRGSPKIPLLVMKESPMSNGY